ncbi:MAG: transcription-repair coupling factor [Alphaproteobacteria bacterium]
MKTLAVDKSLSPVESVFYGVPEGQDARFLAVQARALMPEDKILIHVALDGGRMTVLAELLAFFAPDVRVIQFPAWDCLPYDRISPNNETVAQRVAALAKLEAWNNEKQRYPRILLTSVNAALQRVMPRNVLEGASFSARTGETIDLKALQDFLSNGYSRTETVREHGEYAIRGGIIDLFPPGYEDPLRIDLFGSQVESIRVFSAHSQLTQNKIQNFNLQPAAEFALDEKSVARFRGRYREIFGTVREDDPLYEAVSEGRRYNGMDHWLPLFHDRLDTLFDYAPGAKITFDYHARQSYEERLTQVRDFFEARVTLKKSAGRKKSGVVSLTGSIYNPLPISMMYLQEQEWAEKTREAASLSPFGAADEPMEDEGARKGRDFSDIRALPKGDVFAALKAHIAELNRKILVACYSEGSRERLKGLLAEHGITVDPVILSLEHGFVAQDLAVITEQDILGDRLVRKSQRKRKADNFLTEVSALAEGDLVVHIDHGIGRFIALETMSVGNTLHDCLKMEYAGGDKLYVPAENMEVLSRFGSEESHVQLDKMGGAGWQARKARVKKNLMEIADHLLAIAAARKLRRAEQLEIDPNLYNEFTARFPYQETEDQDRAITDVLGDLAHEYPMDRLVCGDVGFGKTEVALRAAYVAAVQGVQVAVAVPTTLLARQHYKNFIERFKGMNIRVEQLSRLVSAKDARSTKEGLADGQVNIVIGTHALFGKGIKFSNLGLLIVDEEQRFGVKQKERLKELKNNIHVLTLTATPIPRTLQMALTGVREMSLIASPPVDRLAIRTFVLPFDPVVIRDAILREHYRGGQSFYVCPRVKDIHDVEIMLKELVPEVKIITAHGQMTPTELEDRMSGFYDRQYDVLLATNIIESGIDIPTANTMVIHRADMFGLSQLYQLRGRIGRSKVRAYAYLTYPPAAKLNPQAMKRLEVMETLDTLGAGFQLASHDMDIRGAGNLLGDQQSGHIREIGVELYQQMLEEAVAAARQGTTAQAIAEQSWSPQINLGTSVLIPETFIEDLNVRMSLYRRLSTLETKEDIEAFAAEMIDRFGKLPEEVENLLNIVSIKQLCRAAGASQVEAGPKGAVIAFHKDHAPDVGALVQWMGTKGGAARLRTDQKMAIISEWPSPAARIKGIQSLMKELAGLTKNAGR